MQVKHYWTIIVQKSHLDKETNNLVLGEAIENIKFRLAKAHQGQFMEQIAKDQLVPLPFNLEVVSYLESDQPNVTKDFVLEIELPNKKIAKSPIIQVHFGKNGRARNRFRMDAVPVSESGPNKFRLVYKEGNREVSLVEIPVFINIEFVDQV